MNRASPKFAILYGCALAGVIGGPVPSLADTELTTMQKSKVSCLSSASLEKDIVSIVPSPHGDSIRVMRRTSLDTMMSANYLNFQDQVLPVTMETLHRGFFPVTLITSDKRTRLEKSYVPALETLDPSDDSLGYEARWSINGNGSVSKVRLENIGRKTVAIGGCEYDAIHIRRIASEGREGSKMFDSTIEYFYIPALNYRHAGDAQSLSRASLRVWVSGDPDFENFFPEGK